MCHIHLHKSIICSRWVSTLLTRALKVWLTSALSVAALISSSNSNKWPINSTKMLNYTSWTTNSKSKEWFTSFKLSIISRNSLQEPCLTKLIQTVSPTAINPATHFSTATRMLTPLETRWDHSWPRIWCTTIKKIWLIRQTLIWLIAIWQVNWPVRLIICENY